MSKIRVQNRRSGLLAKECDQDRVEAMMIQGLHVCVRKSVKMGVYLEAYLQIHLSQIPTRFGDRV